MYVQDLVRGYRCACRLGYFGIDCEVDRDECSSLPCQNGATCTVRKEILYYVVVKVHFLIWKLPQDQANGYECTCVLGFTGADCETNIDDCASSPCVNGTCVVSSY